MSEQPTIRDFLLQPGYVCLPAEPTRLAAVVASGVVVTLYDHDRKLGGMTHYAYPIRRGGLSTAMFACPAIVSLSRMLLDGGSTAGDVEARLFGAAENPECDRFEEAISRENTRVGHELLNRFGFRLVGEDLGGARGRKIVFHSGTGEVAVALVDRVRDSDWYPASDGKGGR